MNGDAAPPIGVILNLFREHTDWHGSEEQYYEDKLRLIARTSDVLAVLNATDPRLALLAGNRTNWIKAKR